jgi:hypothetical protein
MQETESKMSVVSGLKSENGSSEDQIARLAQVQTWEGRGNNSSQTPALIVVSLLVG